MSEKKVKGKKINLNKNVVDKSDSELEKEAIQEEHFSIAMVLLIVVVCCLVGVGLGYLLFKIAINSSNSAIILSNLLR